MASLFIYSMKASLCMIAFYFAYKMLLSRETFHRFNRAAILTAFILSMLLPLVNVSSGTENSLARGLVVIERAVYVSAVPDGGEAGLSPAQWAFVVYSTGVLLMLVREAVAIARLRSKTRSGRVVCETAKARVIAVDGDIAPFSWFGNIVIGAEDYAVNRREIITHEMEHVRLGHSWDVLFCNISIIFMWFNPAAWLLKQELQNVHEYEADEAVLRNGVDAKHYQMLLIRKSVGEHLFSLANNLNHNSLKKRITMMKRTRTNPWQRAKAIAVLPIAAVAIAAFANPKVEQVTDNVEKESGRVVGMVAVKNAAPATQQTLASASGKDKAGMGVAAPERRDSVLGICFAKLEAMPSFPGGDEELFKFLSHNMEYPEAAVKNKVKGRVIVRFTVDKDGNVTSPEVVEGVSPELDAEALRVVKSMPKWNPGIVDGKPADVKFTLPISFRL